MTSCFSSHDALHLLHPMNSHLLFLLITGHARQTHGTERSGDTEEARWRNIGGLLVMPVWCGIWQEDLSDSILAYTWWGSRHWSREFTNLAGPSPGLLILSQIIRHGRNDTMDGTLVYKMPSKIQKNNLHSISPPSSTSVRLVLFDLFLSASLSLCFETAC